MNEVEQPSRRWQPGETVALRYLLRRGDGQAGNSWPFIVVRDTDELTALYIPKGAISMRWGMVEGTRKLIETPWRRDTLRLMFPGATHSVWASWDGEGDERTFHGYYINMEEPFRRTAIGFDTNDHTLDVVVQPDLSWAWKDLEDFERLVATGSFSAEFGAAVKAEGERAIGILERRGSPFCDGWDSWQPDLAWGVPVLPENWFTHLGAVWKDRVWAYGEIAK